MKWKSTVFLLLAVTALGAFILYFEHDQAGTEQKEAQALRALSVRPDSVTFLEIESSNLVISCSLVDQQWIMHEPVRSFADRGEIRRILTGMEALSGGEVITMDTRRQHGLNLHEYGLAQPRVRITWVQDGKERTLLVGDEVPLGRTLYVMETNRQDIVATSTNILSLVPETAEILRSRILLPGRPADLQRIEIRRAAGFLQLAHNDDGQWMIQQPSVYRADASFVRDLASKFLHARIVRFIADEVMDFTPYGLDDPAVNVTLWPAGEAGARSVAIGGVPEEDPGLVYARADEGDSVYAISGYLLTDANLDDGIFRDRRLMRINPTVVSYIEIRNGERVVELQKDDAGGWSSTKPVQRRADNDVVWNLVQQWAKAGIEAFVTDVATNIPEIAEGNPDRRLLMASRAASRDEDEEPLVDGKNKVTVEGYAMTNNPERIRVKLAHEEALFEIDADFLELLSLNPLDYYDRLVLQLVPEDVRKIEIVRGGKVQSAERDEDGVFQAAGDTDLVDGIVETILALVMRLRADRFVAETAEDPAVFGLAHPELTLTLGLTGEAGISKSLVFGHGAEDGGSHAMIRGQDPVFVVPQSVRTILDRDLVTPRVPADEPAPAESP